MDSEDRQSESNDEARNERDDDPDDRSEVVQDEITPDIGDSPQPGASSFSPTEFCVCPGETTLLFDINEAICPLCGKLIDKTVKEATTSAADESGASANGHVDALISTLVQGLVIVPPEASLQDEIFASTQENWSVDTDLPCEEGQGGIKIPVESISHPSVQVPCPPLLLKFYVLKQDHIDVNEMLFSLHFIEYSEQGRVTSSVRQLEQHLGMRFQVVPLGKEHSTQAESKHLHTINVDQQITVTFQLLGQCERKFLLRGDTFEVPLICIKSLCQNRIPGSVAQVCVMPICEPGEVCQDHIKMTINTGHTIHIMLIPIWSSRPADQGE